MRRLRAVAQAVKGQAKYKDRIRAFGRWRDALDKERLVWWEVTKHATVKGKSFNRRHYFEAWRRSTEAMKKNREDEEMVKLKMNEVRSWLAK
jgi:hypothetical protein